jgi:hypothetical protein
LNAIHQSQTDSLRYKSWHNFLLTLVKTERKFCGVQPSKKFFKGLSEKDPGSLKSAYFLNFSEFLAVPLDATAPLNAAALLDLIVRLWLKLLNNRRLSFLNITVGYVSWHQLVTV